MTRRCSKRRRRASELESNPSSVRKHNHNTRRLLFGSNPDCLINESLSDPLRRSYTAQLLRPPNSIVSIPSTTQPFSTRSGPCQQVQMLRATPDTIATIAEPALRRLSDVVSSDSGDSGMEFNIEDESDDESDDEAAAAEPRTRKARKEEEEQDVETVIKAMKARTAKQRNDALLAHELNHARRVGEAWAIKKEKAGYANYTQDSNHVTTDHSGYYPSRIRRGPVLTGLVLLPPLSSFNYEHAEVSITMSERREKAQWKPPFIPRSFQGRPFALLSDAEHPNDRSDTTEFTPDVSNAGCYKSRDVLLDRFGSKCAIEGHNGNLLEDEAVEVSKKPNFAKNKQALLDAKPSTHSSLGNARPRYFDFISSRGNEYFCEIDEDYLTDRFNLTGLNTDVQYYQYALDLVTDVFDLDCDDDMREAIEKSARHLYGLVHARYITTTRGLAKMVDKYKKGDFGKCPRVMCNSHLLLPTGMADLPNVQSVKLYCSKCEDLYNPKSSRHSIIDGAYFGTSFQNILFQVYPALIPEKSIKRYEPKVFGFKVHAAAALQRWQDGKREDMQGRLKPVGFENAFVEDTQDFEEEMQDEEATLGGEGMEVGEELAD